MGPKAKTSAPSKKAVEKKKEKVIEVNISPNIYYLSTECIT